MGSQNVRLTKQMAKAIFISEAECQRTKSQSLLPVHLLIGCLEQDSFTIEEAKHKTGININAIRNSLVLTDNQISGIYYEHFNFPVSLDTKKVLEEAFGYMRGFKQIFFNEWHVLKALINAGYVEEHLTLEQKHYLLANAAVSRDMLMDLTEYSRPELKYQNIRKVSPADSKKLIQFIESEFSGRWTETIKKGLDKNEPSIFIAMNSEGDIVGFAAFDVGIEDGFFGPMGVAIDNRSEGIGYSLPHQCINEMKIQGYTEIIIGGAGPIEFYVRSCGAKVILNGQ